MGTPRVTLITPTSDRPFGLALAERWIARQTLPPDEWIVVDDGQTPTVPTMGQLHVRRARELACSGAESLCRNLLAALPRITGDVVVIIEDDDWYKPTHLERITAQIARRGVMLAGDDQQRYYNVPQQMWRIFKNRGASLCQTAFHCKLIPLVERVIRESLRRNQYGIDALLWTQASPWMKSLERTQTVVGIKGLPGRVGLGIGHRPQGSLWKADPAGSQLRAWIGSDAAVYRQPAAEAEEAIAV
jgi:hypothetical protein